ncbi:MAG: response regulator [Candidatus Sedimenticola sp. (ex Thyasira tokunagai)]
MFSFRDLFQRKKKKGARSTPERRRNQRAVTPEGSKILIVDDSKTVRLVLMKMLQQAGYETLTAAEGKTAIIKAQKKLPDLIIMDVFMPDINGFQATRYLRKRPETRHIPIIIISGNPEGADKLWGLKVGADTFLVKPFSRGDLFGEIEQLLYKSKPA